MTSQFDVTKQTNLDNDDAMWRCDRVNQRCRAVGQNGPQKRELEPQKPRKRIRERTGPDRIIDS